MIRITAETADRELTLKLPKEYLGRKLEIIVFAVDEAREIPLLEPAAGKEEATDEDADWKDW